MPVFFDCTLVCDAEGCENTQPAIAELRSTDVPGALLGLLGVAAGEKAPFVFSYDRSTGHEWVVGRAKAACSPVCHAKVVAEKGKRAPRGSERPLESSED